MWAIGEPSGPIENGTTYIVRPRIEPRNRPVSVVAHLGRVAPVVGRAGVLLALGADERAVLDARDVAGVRQRQVGVRPLGVGRAARTCPRRPAPGTSAVVLLRRAVAPVDRVGLRERPPPPRPSRSSFAIRGRATVVADVVLIARGTSAPWVGSMSARRVLLASRRRRPTRRCPRRAAGSPGVLRGTSTRRLNSATSMPSWLKTRGVHLDRAAVGLGPRLALLEHLGLARTACRRGTPAPGG